MKKNLSCALIGGYKEDHGQPIYCIAWAEDTYFAEERIHQKETTLHKTERNNVTCNDDANILSNNDSTKHCKEKSKYKEFRYMATCGSNRLSLYEVQEIKGKRKQFAGSGLTVRQAYVDVDEEEIFYSCIFLGRGAGSSNEYLPRRIKKNNQIEPNHTNHDDDNNDEDNSDTSSENGPQLCCVAGKRGIIKIIDTVKMLLVSTLSGHGNEIYDMSVCPTDEWMLLSASKDESTRLWNVRNGQCIAIFAGHEGHRDAVLSVNWHPLGEIFVTGGMDESIKIWSMDKKEIQNAIASDERGDENFRTIYQQLPLFSTSMLHANYVDCVQFVGDLVLSKSTTGTIALWKPDLLTSTQKSSHTGTKTPNSSINGCNEKFQHLCDFDCKDCDVWYVRFGTNDDCTLLAIGNKLGDLRLFHIDTMQQLQVGNPISSSVIRQVSFCGDNKTLIAVCDDASIWRWAIG